MAPRPGKRSIFIITLLLIAATVAVYWPVARHQFVNYDDQDYVTSNPPVQAGLTWNSVVWAFTTSHAGNWHPLTWLSHMVDCQVYGMNAGGHHLTNLLLHLANTLLLFSLLKRMTGNLWPSAAVAAFFAIHPLHVESVAWASERKDVLSAFFFFLTIWAYVSYAERREKRGERREESRGPIESGALPVTHHASRITHHFYLLALLLFAFGLMSKPMLVTVPFVLLLLDYWPLKRMSSVRSLLPLVIEKLPFFALSFASSLITLRAQRRTVAALQSLPLDLRIENVLASYMLYIKKMVLPVGLVPFYPFPLEHPLFVLVLALLILGGITVAMALLWKRAPYLSVGWLWYLGMLVPVIGLVQVGRQSMADRYTYLPSIGLFIAACWGLNEMRSRFRHSQLVLGIGAAVSLTLCLLLTAAQVRRWKDSETLFRYTLSVTPNNPVAHHCLGCVLVEQNKIDDAAEHFSETVRLQPDQFEARNNLGLARVIQGKLDEAIEQYETVLASKPNFEKTHYNLGKALERKGQQEEAIAHYTRAVELYPNYNEARLSLANALGQQGHTDEAARQFAELLKTKPGDANLHYDLATLLKAQGRTEEALSHFLEVSQLNPADPDAHEQAGLLFAAQNRLPEALSHFNESARLRPSSEAFYHVGLVLVMQGHADLAIAHYRKSLELKPDSPAALNDLAWLLATHPAAELRNGAEAVRLAEHACELTQGKEARFLGTLDAAYAEVGRFAEATQTAQKARELAQASQQTEIANAAEERLKLYASEKPFHQAPQP